MGIRVRESVKCGIAASSKLKHATVGSSQLLQVPGDPILSMTSEDIGTCGT